MRIYGLKLFEYRKLGLDFTLYLKLLTVTLIRRLIQCSVIVIDVIYHKFTAFNYFSESQL